jgi:hypothetical protein
MDFIAGGINSLGSCVVLSISIHPSPHALRVFVAGSTNWSKQAHRLIVVSAFQLPVLSIKIAPTSYLDSSCNCNLQLLYSPLPIGCAANEIAKLRADDGTNLSSERALSPPQESCREVSVVMADNTVATEKCCRGAQEQCEAERKGSGRCCGAVVEPWDPRTPTPIPTDIVIFWNHTQQIIYPLIFQMTI